MKKKLLSIWLTVSLLIPMLSPLTAMAEGASPLAVEDESIRTATETETVSAVSEPQLARPFQGEAITDDDLPFAMTEGEILEQGFVGRVKGAERDLHSIVMEKADGSLTLHYYNHPVKYVDGDGKIRDKSDKLQARSDGSFETVSSDIRTAFPKRLQDGITMQKGNHTIRMAPAENLTATGTLSADQTTVTYAVNARTRYEYSLTAMGFKEDIVVAAYTGQTEYSFTLQTGGLTAVNQYGTWVLVDEDNTVRASLSDVIVFTADERNNTFGELRVEEITAGQTYRLTVVLDADWLADPKTAYPITIDPSVNYANTIGNIEDLVVGTSTTYNGASASLYVGRGSSGAKIRTLMRFPNLNISGYNVTDARIELRDIMCEGTAQTVECYEYIGTAWQEGTSIPWSGMGSAPLGAFQSSKSIVYGGGDKTVTGNSHRYAFNITALAQKWAAGTASPSKGVIFKATDDYETGGTKTFKTFASINRGSNQPSIVINYAASIYVRSDVSYITEGESVTLSAIRDPANATVTWTSGNETIATVDANGVITAHKAGTVEITGTLPSGEASSCYLTVLLPDGVYYIQNAYSDLYLSTDVIYGDSGSVMQDEIKYTYPEFFATLWKIYHLGNGMYSIRPMHMLKNALYSNDSTAVIHKDNGTADTLSAVPSAYRWKIEYGASEYIFTNANSNRILTLSADTDLVGASVVGLIQTASQLRHHWNLIRVEAPINEIILYDLVTNEVVTEDSPVRYISRDSTMSLEDLKLAAVVSSSESLDQSLYYSPSDVNIALINSSDNIFGRSTGSVYIEIESLYIDDCEPATFEVIVPELANGTYYIVNRQHNKYVQADDATAPTYTLPGVTLEQWEFNDSNDHQKWIVELQYDGYYRIQSALSGLYMATQLGGEGTEDLFILQENYVDTPRQLWKIELTSHGSYKVKAKSSEPYDADLAMVAANIVNGSSNGIQVQQRLYVDNNSYKDEWYFSEHQIFYFTVNNYFDDGYSVRFNETNAQSAAKINSYMEEVADRYFELFGIIIEYNSATYYKSPLDKCKGTVTEDNVDDPCKCGLCSNRDNAHAAFRTNHPGTDTMATVYWTGHSVTSIGNDGDVDENRSMSWYFSVIMLELSDFWDRDADSISILMHELNHQLGANDHYHENEDDEICENYIYGCTVCGDTKRPMSCIMQAGRIDITSETVLCDACYSDILAHLKSHHEG